MPISQINQPARYKAFAAARNPNARQLCQYYDNAVRTLFMLTFFTKSAFFFDVTFSGGGRASSPRASRPSCNRYAPCARASSPLALARQAAKCRFSPSLNPPRPRRRKSATVSAISRYPLALHYTAYLARKTPALPVGTSALPSATSAPVKRSCQLSDLPSALKSTVKALSLLRTTSTFSPSSVRV